MESKEVLRLKDQFEVPVALEKSPSSTESWTEERETESAAVPETKMVPETAVPLAGEVMVTEGVALATLMVKFLVAV